MRILVMELFQVCLGRLLQGKCMRGRLGQESRWLTRVLSISSRDMTDSSFVTRNVKKGQQPLFWAISRYHTGIQRHKDTRARTGDDGITSSVWPVIALHSDTSHNTFSFPLRRKPPGINSLCRGGKPQSWTVKKRDTGWEEGWWRYWLTAGTVIKSPSLRWVSPSASFSFSTHPVGRLLRQSSHPLSQQTLNLFPRLRLFTLSVCVFVSVTSSLEDHIKAFSQSPTTFLPKSHFTATSVNYSVCACVWTCKGKEI